MVLSGMVSSIIHYKPETKWGIFMVKPDTSKNQAAIKMTGVADISIGDFIDAEGEYKESKYGCEFKASYISQRQPSKIKDYVPYLVRNIEGVGVKTAQAIVDRFQENTFDVICNSPEKLVKIKRISAERAESISSQLRTKSTSLEEQMYFMNLGISPKMADKIKNQYDDYQMVLSDNPYQMIGKIKGIGFRTADFIAGKSGVSKDSESRIESGCIYLLDMAANAQGHTYLPQEEIIDKTSKFLGVSKDSVSDALLTGIAEGNLILEGKNIYTKKNYELEVKTAKKISDLCSSCRENKYDKEQIYNAVKAIERIKGINLADCQRKAVVTAVMNGITVITGGPGTGKTTVLSTVIDYFLNHGYGESDIVLASPTGKAAKRMHEQTGMEASTIHRLVMSSVNRESGERALLSEDGELEINENNLQYLDASVVIIDEMSMVNLSLMNMLLSIIRTGTKLIMVGDIDQLPAIGIGQVLKDIIRSGKIPVCRLSQVFRQAGNSTILENSIRINKGQQLVINPKADDFVFYQCSDAEKALYAVKELVKNNIPRKFGITYDDIQILCPMRKGPLGVTALNVVMQECLNPSSDSKKEFVSKNGTLFREGDKVIHIKNDYNIAWTIENEDDKGNMSSEEGFGVFNGEVGKIYKIDDDDITILYDNEKYAVYNAENMNEIELAYAMTIHKSQGSEYPVVVMPLLTMGMYSLYNRNCLYTGITRGKMCDVIIGKKDVAMSMISNNTIDERNSKLANRIRAYVS